MLPSPNRDTRDHKISLWLMGCCFLLISIAQEDGEDDEDGDSAGFLGRSSDALAKLRPWRRLLKL